MPHDAPPTVATPAANPPTVDASLFRKVMGSFTTGVTVVSLDADGTPRGMTANAFMSASLTPPLCVVSVAKRAHTHAFLSRCGRFGINILAQDQQVYARHFSGKAVAGLHPRFVMRYGVPMLADAIAHIVAARVATHDCGDHTLFVGNVLDLACDDRAPLLYRRGGFGKFEPAPETAEPLPDAF